MYMYNASEGQIEYLNADSYVSYVNWWLQNDIIIGVLDPWGDAMLGASMIPHKVMQTEVICEIFSTITWQASDNRFLNRLFVPRHDTILES